MSLSFVFSLLVLCSCFPGRNFCFCSGHPRLVSSSSDHLTDRLLTRSFRLTQIYDQEKQFLSSLPHLVPAVLLPASCYMLTVN
jgi:hypothetical protein